MVDGVVIHFSSQKERVREPACAQERNRTDAAHAAQEIDEAVAYWLHGVLRHQISDEKCQDFCALHAPSTTNEVTNDCGPPSIRRARLLRSKRRSRASKYLNVQVQRRGDGINRHKGSKLEQLLEMCQIGVAHQSTTTSPAVGFAKQSMRYAVLGRRDDTRFPDSKNPLSSFGIRPGQQDWRRCHRGMGDIKGGWDIDYDTTIVSPGLETNTSFCRLCYRSRPLWESLNKQRPTPFAMTVRHKKGIAPTASVMTCRHHGILPRPQACNEKVAYERRGRHQRASHRGSNVWFYRRPERAR